MKEPLKYPPGSFTWLELAVFNGTDKPGSWQRFDEAKKTNTLIFAGERPPEKGKRGKPEKLWTLNPDITSIVPLPPKPVVVKPVEPKPVVVKPVEPKPVVVAPVVITEPTLIENVVKINFDTTTDDEIVEPRHDTEKLVTVESKTMTPTEINETCPVCNCKLFYVKDATGFMVYCAQPLEICKSTENPFGHGKSVKDGYEILCQKWNFGRNRTKA